MHEAGGRQGYPRHFDGTRFFNPDGSHPHGLRDVWRWQRTSRREPSPKFVTDVEPSKPPARAANGEVRVTLVNHSTALIQSEAANVLTDPIWSERASPLSWIGPRRHRAPGVRREDLPEIDLVLLSHDHYDHLDLPTLCWLRDRGHSTFVAPLGAAGRLRRHRIEPVHELDWGGSQAFAELKVHCVPAVHFAGRGLFDRNRTLWCGYVIEIANSLIYFAADTAFGGHFEQLRARFGPPRLALLPIGAYEPRWFMSPVHMDPEDAVKAHEILGALTSIAIHHGTFQLGDESIDTPARKARSASWPESFLILNNGESATLLECSTSTRSR